MHDRSANLLKHLVRLYISNAEPVSSSALVGINEILDVSSATIRSEMANLENEGFVSQPHTSAGRVPTEKGYRFYIDNFLEMHTLLQEVEKRLSETANLVNESILLKKRIAKTLAELTHEVVIISIDENDIYYTGLSYLLSQPEFREQAQVTSVSQLLEQCEQIINELSNLVAINDTQIFLGRENPFGESCALVISPIQQGFIGILGPMRMDYDYTFTLMNRAIQLFNHN